MFIPDRGRRRQARRRPPKILLDGWGYQDTHETLNTFTWGPDGWLYGCHGVFTHSHVGKPGTPDDERHAAERGVWRYHPTRHEFEVFADGTSNPWGVDFDDYGQAFIDGVRHSAPLPHDPGRALPAAGRAGTSTRTSTTTSRRSPTTCTGSGDRTPHGGNGRVGRRRRRPRARRRDDLSRRHAGPSEYRGHIFMNNIHGAAHQHGHRSSARARATSATTARTSCSPNDSGVADAQPPLRPGRQRVTSSTGTTRTSAIAATPICTRSRSAASSRSATSTTSS